MEVRRRIPSNFSLLACLHLSSFTPKLDLQDSCDSKCVHLITVECHAFHPFKIQSFADPKACFLGVIKRMKLFDIFAKFGHR